VLRVGSGILASFEGELLPGDESFCGAALRSGTVLESADLSQEPHAYPGEQELGAGPALAAALPGASRPGGVLLVLRPPGAPPFGDDERATLSVVAGFAGSALAGAHAFAEARARRVPVDAWRRDRETAAWRHTYDAVAAGSGLALMRVELATGRIQWGGGVEALAGLPGEEWGATVDAWAQQVAAADRERVVRALAAAGGVSRLQISATVAGGRAKRLRLDTFPDASEPGVLAALLAAADEPQRDPSAVPVAALIRAVRHELNNPLAVVAGTVHLMEASGAADGQPELARSVQQIRDASDRLRDLSARIGLLERMPEAAFVTEGGGLGVAGNGERGMGNGER
ncbi:MAG TPA: histidine kinase dimerization/phospho-acceptor domain-containing protein, partial [Longimicrobium sp.]|nr:histidine kinase dimerization/phospho-acceptor domain-containing protein [Longimicrobium sp.]